jgi:hypothetical protein
MRYVAAHTFRVFTSAVMSLEWLCASTVQLLRLVALGIVGCVSGFGVVLRKLLLFMTPPRGNFYIVGVLLVLAIVMFIRGSLSIRHQPTQLN